MAEIVVNGKRVTLRERYPLGEHKDLVGVFRAMDPGDVSSMIPLATRMIEAWEFEGDPTEAASYDALDVPTEAWPLYRELNTFWALSVTGAREEGKKQVAAPS